MHATPLLLVAIASTASGLSPPMRPRMPAPTDDAENLQQACQSAATAMATDAPEPEDPKLAEYLSQASRDAPPNASGMTCGVTAAMPASLSSAFSSYDAQTLSYGVAAMSTAIAACGGDGADQREFSDYLDAVASYTSADCAGTAPDPPNMDLFALGAPTDMPSDVPSTSTSTAATGGPGETTATTTTPPTGSGADSTPATDAPEETAGAEQPEEEEEGGSSDPEEGAAAPGKAAAVAGVAWIAGLAGAVALL